MALAAVERLLETHRVRLPALAKALSLPYSSVQLVQRKVNDRRRRHGVDELSKQLTEVDLESMEVRAEREIRAWVAHHGIQNLSAGRLVQHFKDHTTLRVRMGRKRVLGLLHKLGLRYGKYVV